MRRLAATFALIITLTITAYSQGLGFTGLEQRIEERTSYNVFSGKSPYFKDCLDISFNIKLLPQTRFGYFLRIKEGGKDPRIWNMFYDGQGDNVIIRLNEEGHQSLIKAELPHSEMQILHWTDVRLTFDSVKDSVYLKIGEHEYKAGCKDLPERFSPDIYFGKSDHIIDVPTFAIKNLKVSDIDSDYFFPLDEYEGNAVYDLQMSKRGTVTNPDWLILESLAWKKSQRLHFSTVAGTVYNKHLKEMYYFDRDSIYVCNILDRTVEKKKFVNTCPVNFKLGNCFISNGGDSLYVYELFFEKNEVTDATVASLDLETMVWKAESRSALQMPMHHHTSFRLPGSGDYTIFGGFGKMMYNGRFYSLGDDMQWKELWAERQDDSVKIFPRYFTSAGTDKDNRYAYVYGGMGNECGEQIVGREYYYDLHRIDLNTGKTDKIWELDWKEENKVPVRGMVVVDSLFYTLCYPEYKSVSALQLYEFSIPDGTYRAIGTEIPISSDKMRTNANIYYDEDINKLFATVQVFPDDISSNLVLWTMSFPPAALNELNRHNWFSIIPLWIKITVCILLLLVIITVWIVCARRIWYRKDVENGNKNSPDRKIFRSETRPNAIYIFGDFMVTDRNGNDITPIFTPQQMTILNLLIKRIRDNGMSSKRLSNILWPDKDEDKVKNSRGVAINHLRKSLSNLDGISVVFRDGRYIIEYEEPFYCDYIAFLEQTEVENADMDKLLCVVSRGKFMQYNDDPVFDTFKEKTENKIVPMLHKEIDDRYSRREWQAVCEIAEMLFWIDPLDEKAMKSQICAMKKMKMVEEALVVYARFTAEHKKTFGTEYEIPFNKI